jgi:hypothetical protein
VFVQVAHSAIAARLRVVSGDVKQNPVMVPEFGCQKHMSVAT